MPVTIGYAQYEVKFGDWDANAQTVRRLAAEAAQADLLVYPELALTGYDFPSPANAAEYGECFGEGPTTALAQELAAKHETTIVIGYPENSAEGCYNACLLALPDQTVHHYRKIHLFNREKELFLPGDAPPPVVKTPAGRVGLMICFDWLFPETVRVLALEGAQIVAHPSNLVLPWCQRAMFARSVENRVFTITANRIGTETQAGRTLTFTGASQVLSPTGETLAQAPQDAEHIGLAAVDPTAADDKSPAPFNHLLHDRRPDLYGALQHHCAERPAEPPAR